MATLQYYRNIVEISDIEPGALWKRQGNDLILVDDDQFVKVKYSKKKFEPSDNPRPDVGQP